MLNPIRHDIVFQYEKEMESRKWADEIPFLKFKPDWEVLIVPPFMGAVIRFYVKKGNREVSVYLDCYNNLGSMAKPYWEVRECGAEDSPRRFYMERHEDMLKEIDRILNE